MKLYNFTVWVDGFPYKKYQTIGGARAFVRRLCEKDRREREIAITDAKGKAVTLPR